MRLQRRIRQSELEQAVAVGGQEAAAGAERGYAFHQRADEFRPDVEVQRDRVFKGGGKQLVLYHQRRHAHQGHGVLVEAALVARNVEHTDHVAKMVGDGGGGTGQEVVGRQVVLVGVDQGRRIFGNGGADRIGAPAFFGPGHAGLQRDAVGLFQEVVIAERMDDYPVGVGQDHHIVSVDDLLIQGFHGRQGVGVQQAVLFYQYIEVTARQRIELRSAFRIEAIG